ncbi:rhomboid family intramembrane serine protease [bacterium]|nr:rhomboid family intramembrane serine protease [bacterium]NDC93991.1 rhomboid family intramembrane serine protease [bacterium]NDD83296.1 rhomboid family intramembrane serine protease [bacterium]
MITALLFVVGFLSLFFIDPEITAFYYNRPVNFAWLVRIITHMVSHANLPHLLGNFVFGLPFMLYSEYKLKSHVKFLKLFFYTGLAALLGQGIAEQFMPLQVGGVIGSSGAIFGILGFALASADETKWVRLLALATLGFHIFNQGLLTWYSIKGLTFGIAFAAHLAGMLAGVAIALILRRRNRRRPGPSRSRKRRP